jgi:hypothetical protein
MVDNLISKVTTLQYSRFPALKKNYQNTGKYDFFTGKKRESDGKHP